MGQPELQKRANRANQLVLFFLAGANFWEKHAKQAKTRENRRKTGAFLVLIFWGGKLVGANFYAFCNYALLHSTERRENTKTSSLIYQEDSRVTEASTVLFVLCKLTWTGHERCSVGHQRHLRLAFRLSKA